MGTSPPVSGSPSIQFTPALTTRQTAHKVGLLCKRYEGVIDDWDGRRNAAVRDDVEPSRVGAMRTDMHVGGRKYAD